MKAVETADPANAEHNVAKEIGWQVQNAPKNLREEISRRVTIQKENNRITIKIKKDNNF